MIEEFEKYRAHLHAVAYRMLGARSDADDAVQEAWLRLERSDASVVENLRSWLTTVVARVCLDMLRARKRRAVVLEPPPGTIDPATEAELADSVGLALLVVLELLDPAERLAFVLHDLFAVPFDEIAPIVGRTAEAARQLASRARRRVQGAPAPDVEVARQREVVEAFLAASRGGDLGALIALLDPEVVLRLDAPNVLELRGADKIARRAAKGAVRGARGAQTVLVDGRVGVVVAPFGRLMMVMRFQVRDDKIVEIDCVADPARLAALELTVLEA